MWSAIILNYLIKQKKVIYQCSGAAFQQCLLHTNFIHSVWVFKCTFDQFTCILSMLYGLENVFLPEILHLILLCQFYMKSKVSRQLNYYLGLTVTPTLILLLYCSAYFCCFTTIFVSRPVWVSESNVRIPHQI